VAAATVRARAPAVPEPLERTKQGRLEAGDALLPQDNSYYDAHPFETGEGWLIVVTMESDDVDSYIHLLGPDGNTLLQNDDRAAGDLDAELRIDAPQSGTYVVYANSLNAGETGAYVLTIRTTPPGAP
jgi:serine protease Do